MKNYFKITLLLFITFLSLNSMAQYGQMPPFTVQVKAINGINIPGLHSFAFAQSGTKWLFIGGRTNGMHGMSSNDGFPVEYANTNVTVIDTSTWTYYQSDLNLLPPAIADPMSSTNMQFIQDGNYLYMVGGYGYDNIAGMFVTYPKLTAIHINNTITAVVNAQSIAPHIRQITDTNLAICGGNMGKIGNDFYLIFGHYFGGRYSDPPSPTFTQKYSDQIKKFNLADNGTTITLSGYTYPRDTTHFHRRDLNVGPIVKPNGALALEAYGGVFQKTKNLPFQEPITIDASGTSVNTNYLQMMSHYTCALLPVYDSVTKKMYTTFFGGIGLYDFNHNTNLTVKDTLVPFINDITTLTTDSNGVVEETVLPIALPGLLGSNSIFIPNLNVPHYPNEVIKIRELPNSKTFVGYMFGGIRANQANLGTSTANDSIYRIYITPNNTTVDVDELNTIHNTILFPNPSTHHATLLFTLKENERVEITLSDITGKEMQQIADTEMQKGNQKINIHISHLSAGIYICKIKSSNSERIVKLVVGK